MDDFQKWLLANGISFHPIPKCDDEVKNLTDEALVEMSTRNMRDIKPGGMRVDEVAVLMAGVMACARELDRRGKGHLLAAFYAEGDGE